MIAVVDSGLSNLASVLGALGRVRAPVRLASTAQDLEDAIAVILPGVGAFGDAMAGLRDRGLVAPILRAAQSGRPVLGICLGMQLLVDESEEHGLHAGLGLIPGRVRRLEADQPGFRVPNIGWSEVTVERSGVLFPDRARQESFYFVHSYHVDTAAENVASTIRFGSGIVASALEAGNVYGVQFHPEKSQDAGLDLLARWVTHVAAVSSRSRE